MQKSKARQGGLSAGQVVWLSLISCQCAAFSTVSVCNRKALYYRTTRITPAKDSSSAQTPEPSINGYSLTGHTPADHSESDAIIDAEMDEDTTRMSAAVLVDEIELPVNQTGSSIVPWTELLAAKYSTESHPLFEDESNDTVAAVSSDSTQPPPATPELKKSWLDYDSAYTVLASALIGAMTGFAVAIFKLSVEALREVLYGGTLSDYMYWWLIPTIGAFLVGLLSMTGEFSPGLRGMANEIDACSLSTDTDQRFTKPMRFLRKPLGAILTLGSGNSLGPEGPSVEIGMTFSRLVMPPSITSGAAVGLDEETVLTNRVRRNRLLLSAGAAAGVSAGFNAPLSGVFFALEIVQQSFSPIALPSDNDGDDEVKLKKVRQGYFSTGSGSITAILLSSVLSALVAKVYLGEHLVLHIPDYDLQNPLVELPMYMLLGVITGSVSGIFSAVAQFFKRFFDGAGGPGVVREVMLRVPKWAKPVIGGALCGSIALFYPQILFFGYETLNSLMGKNALPLSLILILLGLKIIATAISAGSGLVGGTFAPSLFLGGMTGAAFHRVAEKIIAIGASGGPFMLADVQAYALVGAAGVLSGLFRAPLTASLILFELTRDYDVILPLMVTASIASVVGDAVEKALEEKRRDRDAVSWGDLSDPGDIESNQPR